MKEGDRQTSDRRSENQIGCATNSQTGRPGFTSAPYPLIAKPHPIIIAPASCVSSMVVVCRVRSHQGKSTWATHTAKSTRDHLYRKSQNAQN